MTDFLLELRSEEIPARMQAKGREDLARLFAAELATAGLAATETVTYATPRRLALIARGLPNETQATRDELKGPKTGAPPQALEGFLRKTGLTREALTERDGVLYAVTERPGRATADVLAQAIPSIIRQFPWPKSMRWGDASASPESLRWVRPLHGIVALFGEEIVPVELAGITSGAATLGHRFHHPGPITIGSASDYAEKLRACHVIVDQDERAAIIRDRAAALAAEAGLELIADEGLVAENAGLTEWPVPLLGRFDEAFLDVPPEVIQLTARVNQKYFVCSNPPRSRGGGPSAQPMVEGAQPQATTLANAFICVANIAARDGGARIVEGNRKVLAARLSDARFFYETDLKTSLEDHAKKLDRIVFHEKLGTVADKVDRVAKLARWLVEEGIVGSSQFTGRGTGEAGGGGPTPGAVPVDTRSSPFTGRGTSEAGGGAPTPSTIASSAPPPPSATPTVPLPASGEDHVYLATLAERAARLAKADLVTGMVGEFPELQGVMGGYYAAAQGEDPQVAAAIRDHYKPVGQGDEVPTAPVTVAVSLADKLDTVVAFFAIDERPTGSKDPFALRRASLGALALLITNNLRVSLSAFGPSYLALLARQITWNGLKSNGLESFAQDVYIAWLEGRSFGLNDHGAPYIRNEDGTSKIYGREFGPSMVWAIEVHFSVMEVLPTILPFFADRLKVQQREAGVRHDLIDAVFALGGEDDLVRLLARVRALQAFVGTDDGANLLAGYKRAANILKKEGYTQTPTVTPAQAGVHSDSDGDEAATGQAMDSHLRGNDEGNGSDAPQKTLSYTPEKAETALITALDAAEPAAADAVAREDFTAAMAALATLRSAVDAFFDGVTVNDPDPAKRAARLALLDRVRAAVHTVADFSRIEG